jgi:hypothetical protein
MHINDYEIALMGEKRTRIARRAALWAGGVLLSAGGLLTVHAIGENMSGYSPVHTGTEAHMEDAQRDDYGDKTIRGIVLMLAGGANLASSKLLKIWREAYADAGEEVLELSLYSDDRLQRQVADITERVIMQRDRQWGYYE